MKELLVGVNNPILGSNIAPLPVNTMLPDNDMFSANLQVSKRHYSSLVVVSAQSAH